MTFKFKFATKLFISFCALCPIPILGVPTLGQERQQQTSEAERDKDEPRKIHTDLGGGLELFELTHYKNGKVFSHAKIFKRNGVDVMHSFSAPTIHPDMRSYYQNGKEVMTEIVGKDGNVESFIFRDGAGNLTEAFERKKNGTTGPVSTEKLEQMRRGEKFIQETFGPIAEAAKQGDQKKAEQRIDDALNKIKQMKMNGKKPPAGDDKSSK